MEAFPNTLIRASAGTGKTYQLSNRFIKLLHTGVLPEQILAVTFTRLAAGEILDRIMSRLAAAASDPQICDELSAAIDDPSLAPARCLDLLEQLTRQLHRLHVETLDSYFARLARSFGLELGLPPGWKIIEEVEDEQLRTQSIQTLLRNDAYALASLLKLLFKGDADRSITQQLLDMVGRLYELYRESKQPAWHRFPPTEMLKAAELNKLIREFSQLELPTHKKIVEAFERELGFACEKEWERFIEKGNVKQILEGNTTYYRKEYAPETLAGYHKLIDHARNVLIAELAEQTAATYQVLQLFDTIYSVQKDAARAYRFDDITFRLSRFVKLRSMHLNSFRLDTRVSHLLLDEFQDTSLDQWRVLQPLASHLTNPEDQKSFFFMGGKTSFFCVGDPKQAIYGWRGGRAEIFDALPEQLGELDETQLVKSFRSSPVIIDFVNEVFANCTRHSKLGRAEEAVTKWAKRFPHHETSKQDLPGYVRMVTSRFPEENETRSQANWRYAAEQIHDVHERIPGFSIGVLVRTNQAGAAIVGHLRKRGVPASEERGGNQLSDSAPVQLLLSLVKLADHPGDSVTRYHLATNALGRQLGFTDFSDLPKAVSLSKSLRSELMERGFGRTIAKYAGWLMPYSNPRQQRRLQQLVQLAYSYEDNTTLRPTHFVHFVENKRVPDPTQARVRVMTLHQAKGLEFDIVFLPDIDGNLVSQFKQCVFKRESPSEPVSQISRQCRKEIRAILPPELQSLFDQATYDDVTGELCLIYVAITRAVHALHMVVQPGNPKVNTSSRLITNAVAKEAKLDATVEVFCRGDADWHLQAEPADEATTTSRQVLLEQPIQWQPAETVRPESLTIRTPTSRKHKSSLWEANQVSADADKTTVAASSLLNLNNLEAAARGAMIHKWFQQITWLDQSLLQRDQWLSSVLSIAPGTLEHEQELQNFEKILLQPAIRDSLSKSFYIPPTDLNFADPIQPDEADVFTEYPFVYRVDNEFVSGIIDRLVLLKSAGRVVAADIIDFKTDVLDPENQAAVTTQVDLYRHQVGEYRNAVCRLYGLEHKRVATRLFFVNYDLIQLVEPVSSELES